MRIEQYLKNFLIFAPAFFDGALLNITNICNLVEGFIGFSLICSFVYILNDIRDIEFDKKHPIKKDRILASKIISPKAALLIGFVCLCIGLFLLKDFIVFPIIYILLNLLYMYKVKNFALADIIFVSIGYLIRLFLGAYIADVSLSCWIIIMTFLLAMFLLVAKRHNELTYGGDTRISLSGYNAGFLANIMSVLTSIIIVAYLLYCISPEITEKFHSNYIYITAFFVLLGLFRYLQLTFVFNKTGSPTKIIYSDNFMKITVLLWILSFFYIIYN